MRRGSTQLNLNLIHARPVLSSTHFVIKINSQNDSYLNQQNNIKVLGIEITPQTIIVIYFAIWLKNQIQHQ